MGKNQKEWKTKAESRSPTARTDSVMLASIAEARKERAVGTCGMTDTCLKVDTYELLLTKFMGENLISCV